MRATVIAFIVNIALLFFSYRLVVMGGGLEALGLWSTLMAWIFLIRMGDIGMTSATVRYVSRLELAEHGPDTRRYVDTGIGMNGVLFFVLSIVGYLAFSALIGTLVPGDAEAQAAAVAILPVMFLSFFLTNISGLVLSSLRAIHLGYMSAWLTVAGSLVQLVLVVTLVPRIGLLGLAMGQLGSTC
mgnify:FL=1